MNRPDRLTLRTKEGEAILARLAVYAPHRSDCEMLAQVLRLYCWLMVTVEEAKVRVRRLRALFFGQGRQAKGSSVPDASTSLRGAPGEGQGGGEGAPGAANTAGSSVLVDEEEAAALPIEPSSNAGATRVECRHEELAVGQRCPVCGQGTL